MGLALVLRNRVGVGAIINCHINWNYCLQLGANKYINI